MIRNDSHKLWRNVLLNLYRNIKFRMNLNRTIFLGSSRKAWLLTTTLVILFPFSFFSPPKKRGKKERSMNTKNRYQKSCLSARSIFRIYQRFSIQDLLLKLYIIISDHIFSCFFVLYSYVYCIYNNNIYTNISIICISLQL